MNQILLKSLEIEVFLQYFSCFHEQWKKSKFDFIQFYVVVKCLKKARTFDQYTNISLS